MDCSPPGFRPWDSPDKNTGVGCRSLLQGIFLTQGLNPHLFMSPALQAGSLPGEPVGETAISRHLCVTERVLH